MLLYKGGSNIKFMKTKCQETPSNLLVRSDIHNKFSSRDMDLWMLDLLEPTKGMTILDVGCGEGKHCFSFYNYLKGDADITGGDVSDELLNHARQKNTKIGHRITFTNLDFNKRFSFNTDKLDLISCCFSIHFAENVPFTLDEMHRVLKTGGRLFISGPKSENKRLFYDIIREATGKRIPPEPGSCPDFRTYAFYDHEILSYIKARFPKVEVRIFKNPVTFETVEPFITYTRASLGEEGKTWNNFFQDKEDFERIMQRITEVATSRLQQEGKLVMTKVVGGFIAIK